MSECVEHGAKRKGGGPYPASSHLLLGCLLGHSPAERLSKGSASVCADTLVCAGAKRTKNEQKLKELGETL